MIVIYILLIVLGAWPLWKTIRNIRMEERIKKTGVRSTGVVTNILTSLYRRGSKTDRIQGSVDLIPKKLWHAIKNTGTETLIMVFSYSPSGFEGYFREMGSPAGTPWQPKTKDEYEKLNKKWGIIYR